MERRGSNHFTARHRTNLKTNANTINYSANAVRRASLGWKRPSFPLAKGPPGNPLLRTCPPRQGYGWENYTVSHERLLNHNIAAQNHAMLCPSRNPPFSHPCLPSAPTRVPKPSLPARRLKQSLRIATTIWRTGLCYRASQINAPEVVPIDDWRRRLRLLREAAPRGSRRQRHQARAFLAGQRLWRRAQIARR